MQKLKITNYTDASEMCRILAVNGHKVWMLTEFQKSGMGAKIPVYYVCFEERVSK